MTKDTTPGAIYVRWTATEAARKRETGKISGAKGQAPVETGLRQALDEDWARTGVSGELLVSTTRCHTRAGSTTSWRESWRARRKTDDAYFFSYIAPLGTCVASSYVRMAALESSVHTQLSITSAAASHHLA